MIRAGAFEANNEMTFYLDGTLSAKIIYVTLIVAAIRDVILKYLNPILTKTINECETQG